jgi:hypothetical protein
MGTKEDFKYGGDWIAQSYASQLSYTSSGKSFEYAAETNLTLHAPAEDNIQIHLLNNNDGKGFVFKKDVNKDIWIEENVFKKLKEKNSKLGSLKDDSAQTAGLLSDKTTNILCMHLGEISDAVDLDPLADSRCKIVRSAYISMGYLLRKAICNHLDIDLDELNVDYRIVEDQENNKRVGEIFFSDSLENGAGFCNYVDSNRHLVRKELLEVFTDENSPSKFHKIFKIIFY